MLSRFFRIFSVVFVLACGVNLLLFALGYAQDATEPAAPWWKPLLNMLLVSVIPAFWGAVGPLATAWITKQVNKLGQYVPRPIQVVLSALVTAAAAGLAAIVTGDPSGIATAGVQGATGQVIAATDPATLRTESPDAVREKDATPASS